MSEYPLKQEEYHIYIAQPSLQSLSPHLPPSFL